MITKKRIKIKKEDKFDYSLLVDTAILLGEIMLKNGAETNRVEDDMHKLLKTTKMKHIEAVVMTTSIVVTLSDPSIEHITAVSRIHDRITNLNRVNLASLSVGKYCRNEINLEELFHELKRIKTLNQYSNRLKAIGLILIPPAFTIMLNGNEDIPIAEWDSFVSRSGNGAARIQYLSDALPLSEQHVYPCICVGTVYQLKTINIFDFLLYTIIFIS